MGAASSVTHLCTKTQAPPLSGTGALFPLHPTLGADITRSTAFLINSACPLARAVSAWVRCSRAGVFRPSALPASRPLPCDGTLAPWRNWRWRGTETVSLGARARSLSPAAAPSAGCLASPAAGPRLDRAHQLQLHPTNTNSAPPLRPATPPRLSACRPALCVATGPPPSPTPPSSPILALALTPEP